jgi:hypothetical protein
MRRIWVPQLVAGLMHVLESITGVSTLTGVNSAHRGHHRGQLSTLDGRVSTLTAGAHRGQLSTLDGRVLWAVD